MIKHSWFHSARRAIADAVTGVRFRVKLNRARRQSARQLDLGRMEERVMLSATPAAAAAALAPSPDASTTADLPDTAVLVADADGNGTVVWSEQTADGDWDVLAQRFDALGNLLDEAAQVNTYTEGDQHTVTAAMDSAGNLILVWQSDGQDGDGAGIYAQRYGANGEALGGEFRVNSITDGDQTGPRVATDDQGGFLVAWTSQDEDGNGIYAQRYDAQGIPQGSEFRVNELASGSQQLSSVDAEAAGGYIVRWTVEDSNSISSVFYERQFDANGVALTGDVRLDQALTDVSISTSSEDDLVFTSSEGDTDASASDMSAESLAADYLSAPLAFEFNQGQTDGAVDFLARGSGYAVFLTEGDAVLALDGGDSSYAVRLDLLDAHTGPVLYGEQLLVGRSNYLLGDDSSQWVTDVENFAAVRYDDIYDGIDVRYYGTQQRQLEYDFIVAAGADPGQIQLSFSGTEAVYLDQDGNLVLQLSSDGDELRFYAPVAYQENESGRQIVSSQYVIQGDGTIGFELGDYDTSRELVIDPVLDYLTIHRRHRL